MQEPLTKWARIGILAAVYFVAGKLGLTLAFVHPSATAVWPPAGITLAAFLMLGYRVWPGIFVAAFFTNLTTAGSLATSLGIATGNTLEGLVGAYLITKYAGGRNAFRFARDTFKFAILAGMVSTTVSATFGVTSLSLGGFARWSECGSIWLTWWLGDAVGDVLLAPVLILWISDRHLRWSFDRYAEAFLLLLSLTLVAQNVFGGLLFRGVGNYPLEYLCLPFLLWAAFRFGQREAATATLVLSGIACWGTIHGFGPFGKGTKNESLLLLQAFMGVVSVMTMAVAAICDERKRAAARFGLAVESAPNAMVMVDRQGKIVLVNSYALKQFGYEREELVGQLVDVLVPQRFRGAHPEHRREFSARPQARPMGAGRDLYAVRKDRSEFPVEIGISPIETEDGLLVLTAIVDIRERKRAEEEIQRLATSDPLTGLANYRKLIQVLEAEIKRFGRTGRSFAVLLLDLDGLKRINDQHGHLTGSRALCRLAAILRIYCRSIDTAARYGGDEFALVIPETGAKKAQKVAQRIRQRIAEETELPPLSVSIGTSVCPQDGETIEMLLGAADRDLYEMKRNPTDKTLLPMSEALARKRDP